MRPFLLKKHPRKAGFTAIEVIITIVLAAVLASAFISLLVPQIDLLLYAPHRLRLQKDAFDLMEVIFEGDNAAPGLRYAGPLAGAGLSILEATSDKVKYTFTNTEGEDHTVTLAYDSGTHRINRTVQTVTVIAELPEDGDAQVNPVETNSDGSPAIFRYYNSTPAEFVPTPVTLGQIARVDVAFKISPTDTSGIPSDAGVVFKGGVEIKHLIQVGSAC